MTKTSGILGAIEAGGTKFVCAAGRSADAIISQKVLPTRSPDETFAAVTAFFKEVCEQEGELAGLGVAAFGPIDINPASPRYGALLNTPKSGWGSANFFDALSILAPATMIDTDVNGAALGEWRAGAGRGLSTIAYVTVGTGIGAGIVKDGHALAGFGHYEVGHIRPPHDMARDPFAGCCPFHSDCLEGLASGSAILDRWGASLSDLADADPAIDLQAEYLAYLALTLLLSHMPERIIFGGGVMKTPGLIERLREKTKLLIGGYVESEHLRGDLSSFITPPALGDLAGVTGAFELARRAADRAGGGSS